MYNIVRYYKGRPSSAVDIIIKENVTLEQAQAHCNDPATHGKDWFDWYKEVNPKPKSGYGYQSISEACRLLLTRGDSGDRVRA